MSEFLLLIYENEKLMDALTPEEDAALVTEFRQFMARNQKVLRGGQRLAPTASATSVRNAEEGGVRISDGAFVEAKEVVAGYFVVEAVSQDEAVRLARELPVPHGGVEVRPIRSAPHA